MPFSITSEVELVNFNHYDRLFNAIIPKDQNRHGFPKQLFRIDDGICYSITIKWNDRIIDFNACNPEEEYDLIKKNGKSANKELLDLLDGLINILKILRSELSIEI